MKKNCISKIAATMLIISLILISAIPAFAAEPTKVKVEIAGNDGLVYVRLTAPASSNISTISVPLNYDSTKLQFKEMSYLKDDSIINSTNAEKEGTVVANTVIAESLTEESKIFTYVFKVLDGAAGICEFSFGTVKATDVKNNAVNITFDGNLKAELSTLKPLSPDKIQSSFDPTTLPEEIPTESTTKVIPSEPKTEANSKDTTPATTAPAKENKDKPNIPNTTRKVAAISTASAVAALAIAVSAVAVKKKKDNE